jgi:endonuclease-3
VETETLVSVLGILKEALREDPLPLVAERVRTDRDPYRVLIATLLSLRTKDEVSGEAAERLFVLASTPAAMVLLPEETIARTIYPAGFYRNKARTILRVSRELLENHDSRVPSTLEGLLALKGVGRKTANLVVTLAFGKDGICVDTHVHRISNRFGYVSTKTPNETEEALRRKLPKPFWASYNTILVAFGQTLCRPVSPLCSRCPVSTCCERKGVTVSR